MIIKTIDAHTAGEPLRLIVDGFPRVEGRTILEKREYLREHYDHLRKALMLEPRGHADMYGALLTEPEHPGSHAGVLFMHNEGFSTMCGHGVIAVVTIGIERGLFAGPEVALDSPAGPVHARASVAAGRVTSVSFRNVPSFVLQAALPIRLGSRHLNVDVAFGGAFYAIADAEAVGVPISPERLPDLRRLGMEIKQAVEAAVRVEHPEEPGLHGIYGTIFTGQPSSDAAHLKNVTIFADAAVDRSPCGTGTAAVMAVLTAMGLLGPDQEFVHESIIGTIFRGRVVGTAALSIPKGQRANSQTSNSQTSNSQTIDAIIPEIEGEAYITGESTFLIDDRDPLRYGFRLF
jgi:trans-L-3-hydroxyproline dehydratase